MNQAIKIEYCNTAERWLCGTKEVAYCSDGKTPMEALQKFLEVVACDILRGRSITETYV